MQYDSLDAIERWVGQEKLKRNKKRRDAQIDSFETLIQEISGAKLSSKMGKNHKETNGDSSPVKTAPQSESMLPAAFLIAQYGVE